MMTITVRRPNSGQEESVVKFDGALIGTGLRKPRQVSTISMMTTETCGTDTASLTDEEEEGSERRSDLSKPEFVVSHLLDDLLMHVVSSNREHLMPYQLAAPAAVPSSPSSHENSTPKRSSLPKAEKGQLDSASDLSTQCMVDQLLRKTKNNITNPRPILKRCGMEIPVKNKGWKNLPKLNKLPQNIATATTRSSGTLRRQVRFQAVVVRCFDQCIGDNPAVSYGTPISLDWNYEQMVPIDLESYESSRTVRRTPRQMMMNYYNRRNVLMNRFGFTEEEVVEGEKAASKIRSQRSMTRALLPTACLEDLLTSAGRKAKRKLGVGRQ